MQQSNVQASLRLGAFFMGALAAASSAAAFQVLPKVSDVDRKISTMGRNPVLDYLGHWFVGSAIPIMKSPVHESITLAAIGCNASLGSESECVTLEAVREHRILLYGVRWPDDPPFQLNAKSPPRIKGCDTGVTLRSTSQPLCWWGLFSDAGAQAKKKAYIKNPAFGPGDYMLYRSHYGDLQFMHAMGTYDGESAGDTVSRMRMWAEFLWGIASGTTSTGAYIRELGNSPLAAYFPGDITATNLFATGIVEVRKDLDKVAMGAFCTWCKTASPMRMRSEARRPGHHVAPPGLASQARYKGSAATRSSPAHRMMRRTHLRHWDSTRCRSVQVRWT